MAEVYADKGTNAHKSMSWIMIAVIAAIALVLIIMFVR